MIYRIRVWDRSAGDHLPVGEMICEIAESGRARGAFRYEREYLDKNGAYALDPVSLPLKSDSFSVEHPGVFGVFEDEPLDDSERLYRQMVFNAVVGNTDDHLKNFWMIHDREQGWRLSPAFDLIPDVGRRVEHILFFDLGAYYPGRKNLENLGRCWGIRNAENVVAQVFDAVDSWKEEFAGAGVPEKDITRFKEIDLRLIG